MTPLRIAVAGAAGRMGAAVVRAVHEDPETELAAAVDTHDTGRDAGELAGAGTLGVLVRDSLQAALRETGAQVLVDFTRAEAAHRNALTAQAAGVSPVIGTTGLSAAQLEEIRAEAA